MFQRPVITNVDLELVKLFVRNKGVHTVDLTDDRSELWYALLHVVNAINDGHAQTLYDLGVVTPEIKKLCEVSRDVPSYYRGVVSSGSSDPTWVDDQIVVSKSIGAVEDSIGDYWPWVSVLEKTT